MYIKASMCVLGLSDSTAVCWHGLAAAARVTLAAVALQEGSTLDTACVHAMPAGAFNLMFI
jgi:hypothetical protein